MKAIALLALFMAPLFAAQPATIQELSGTWSGAWIPAGGVRDSMTIELKQEDGRLVGRFVTPFSTDFGEAAFDAEARTLLLEAADAKSGKQYQLDAKVEGTEIRGALTVDGRDGEVHFIKWTYVPPLNRR